MVLSGIMCDLLILGCLMIPRWSILVGVVCCDADSAIGSEVSFLWESAIVVFSCVCSNIQLMYLRRLSFLQHETSLLSGGTRFARFEGTSFPRFGILIYYISSLTCEYFDMSLSPCLFQWN
jgi:hypothetical protein